MNGQEASENVKKEQLNMAKYDPNKFISAISKKMAGRVPVCPYCGGQKFTTTGNVAAILIGDDTSNLNLGPHIPSGMLICENCGHIEFFALGSLGLMEKEKPNNE